MTGTWLARVPWVAERLSLAEAQLGVLLLCPAAGAIISMTVTGQLLARMPSRRLVIAGCVLYPLLAPLPLLAPSPEVLAAVLLAWGALNGIMDVAMNAHGVAVEQRLGRPILSSLHGGWSLGLFGGATVVALSIAVGADAVVTAVTTTVVLLVLGALALPRIGPGSAATAAGGGLVLPSRAVLPIGIIAFLAALIEGGVGEWSGLWMERGLGADPALAALTFGGFAFGLMVARFAGDRLNARLGPVRLVQAGMALVAVVYGAVLLVAAPALVLPGVVLAGIGVSNAIPLSFGAAGRVPPGGPSLAACFTLCYAGFLGGPPVVGLVADRIGLATTLWMVVAVALAIVLLVRRAPGYAPAPADPGTGPAPAEGAATA